MKYVWEDLPEKKSCFTVRNAVMVNLNTGKIIRHYSANTKINVVQKCVTPEKTYYRTQEAYHHYLNYAFEASAFGLPNEKAPSVPSSKPNSFDQSFHSKPKTRTLRSVKKQTSTKKAVDPNGGEGKRFRSWLSRIFRRNNG